MTEILVDLLAEDGDAFHSDSIDIVAYDREGKTLYVEFQSGYTVYGYEGVEESTYNLFIGADSLNRFWRDHISGKYTSTKEDYGTFELREQDETAPEPVATLKAGEMVLNAGGLVVNGALASSVISKPSRYSVRWVDEDNTAISGEPEFYASSDTEALRLFNAAMEAATKLGLTAKVKVKAVTRYFD